MDHEQHRRCPRRRARAAAARPARSRRGRGARSARRRSATGASCASADRDLHALQLAARQRRQPPVGELRDAGALQRAVDGVVVGASWPGAAGRCAASGRSRTASRTVTPSGTRGRWGTNARTRASLRPRSSSTSCAAPAHVPGGELLHPGERRGRASTCRRRSGRRSRRARPARASGRRRGGSACRRSRRATPLGLEQRRAHTRPPQQPQEQRHADRDHQRPDRQLDRRARPRARACRRRRAAPRRRAPRPGSRSAWLDVPPASRTTCGMTSPRKPSSPASAADAAASSAAAMPALEPDQPRPRAQRRGDVVAEREPVERADQAQREHEPDGEVRPDRAAASSQPSTSGRRRGRRSPTARGRGRRSSAPWWPPANSAPIAMPARISRPTPPRVRPGPGDREHERRGDAGRRRARPTGSSAIEPGKTSRISSAPKPAPPVTPITSGDASGLPSAPCSSAPATPSAAPTTIASTVRGSRSCVTISLERRAGARPEQRVDDRRPAGRRPRRA